MDDGCIDSAVEQKEELWGATEGRRSKILDSPISARAQNSPKLEQKRQQSTFHGTKEAPSHGLDVCKALCSIPSTEAWRRSMMEPSSHDSLIYLQ